MIETKWMPGRELPAPLLTREMLLDDLRELIEETLTFPAHSGRSSSASRLQFASSLGAYLADPERAAAPELYAAAQKLYGIMRSWDLLITVLPLATQEVWQTLLGPLEELGVALAKARDEA